MALKRRAPRYRSRSGDDDRSSTPPPADYDTSVTPEHQRQIDEIRTWRYGSASFGDAFASGYGWLLVAGGVMLAFCVAVGRAHRGLQVTALVGYLVISVPVIWLLERRRR